MPNKEIGDETFKHGNVRFPAKKRRITEQVAVNAARHQRGHRREHGAVASFWQCASAPARPPRSPPLPGPTLVTKKLIGELLLPRVPQAASSTRVEPASAALAIERCMRGSSWNGAAESARDAAASLSGRVPGQAGEIEPGRIECADAPFLVVATVLGIAQERALAEPARPDFATVGGVEGRRDGRLRRPVARAGWVVLGQRGFVVAR